MRMMHPKARHSDKGKDITPKKIGLEAPSAAQVARAEEQHLNVSDNAVQTMQSATPKKNVDSVASSAALISVCVIISRITGFLRTWAMAFALGSTLLSSAYQVANNLPNMLYELVVGGMLVTAFLPVYMNVKQKLGEKASNEYASNLLTLIMILLGALTLICMFFPGAVIYTQSFFSDQSHLGVSVFFFQFFAIQIIFYGASAIISGLLNANRDYLWSSIAPVANNIIVIATFLIYAALAQTNQSAALYCIAIGNPLGVFVQMALQIPALRKNGISLKPHINIHDPAIRSTIDLGAPTLLVVICAFIVVSVQNAAGYSFSDNGPSIIAYARLWWTLPYAFLTVPITTALFTELSDMHAKGDIEGMKRGIASGTEQILFFMVPFALYLMVFSTPLVTLYHVGAFTMENVSAIATYLCVFALALPAYSVNQYLQKVFSSLRAMGAYAIITVCVTVLQVLITVFGAQHTDVVSIEIIAVGSIVFYVVADICLFAYLNRMIGSFGLSSIIRACFKALGLGFIGAFVGSIILISLETFSGGLSGDLLQAFIFVLIAGAVGCIVTYTPAILLEMPEAAFLISLIKKLRGKLSLHGKHI